MNTIFSCQLPKDPHKGGKTEQQRTTRNQLKSNNIKHEMKIEKSRKIQLILQINNIVYIDETIPGVFARAFWMYTVSVFYSGFHF